MPEVIFENFTGWNADNKPPTVYPRLARLQRASAEGIEMVGGELLDTQGVWVSDDGVLRWAPDRYFLPAPALDSDPDVIIDLLEYKSGSINQLIGLYTNNATDTAFGYLTTAWSSSLSPTSGGAMYELFHGSTWTEHTTGLDMTDSWAMELCDDIVLIANRNEPTYRWNGTALTAVGFSPPASAPYIAASALDFTTGPGPPGWTEDDASARLTVAAAQITITALAGNEASNHWYDSNAADTYKDFVHKFSARVTAADDGQLVWVWGVSDVSGETVNNWGTDWLGVYLERSGSTYQFGLKDGQTGTLETIIAASLSLNTTYYCTVRRVGPASKNFQSYSGDRESTEAELMVYSDSGRSVLIGYYRGTCSTVPYRYLYAVAGQGDNGANTWSGLVYNLTMEGVVGVGALIAGTHSYYYTFASAEWESMPSPILDVVTEASDRVDLAGILAGPTGTTKRNIYRAYTSAVTQGVQGTTFGLLATIYDNTTTTYGDEALSSAIGFPMPYDYAIPPRGDILCWHKNRAWMAHCSCTSRSYNDYETTDLDNILFYSEIDEPYYWPSGNYIRVGDFTPIVDLVSWGDHLFIFKENGVWVLTGYDEEDYVLTQLSNEVGCIATGSAASGPPGVCWIDGSGIMFFNGAGLRKVKAFGEATSVNTPPNPAASGLIATAHRVAYHRGYFFIALPGTDNSFSDIQMWSPTENKWQRIWLTGQCYTGLQSVNFGTYQHHLLMDFSQGEVFLINATNPTVLFTGRVWANEDGGTDTTLRAKHRITFPALFAPVGYEIVPKEVWIDGSWTVSGTAAKRVKLHINDDADYSATLGQNAWATTPDAPQGGLAIDIPVGYTSGATTKTNSFKTMYVQLSATDAPDFILNRIGIKYNLRATRKQ